MNVDAKALKRLTRYLRKFRAEVIPELKKINKDTAKEVVKVGKAKGKSMGSTFKKAAPSIRAGTSAVGAVVFLGGGRWPYAIGAELGSKQGPRKKQFEYWRGNPPLNPFDGAAGYFLFPAIRESQQEIKTGWVKEMDDWIDRTFPAVI